MDRQSSELAPKLRAGEGEQDEEDDAQAER